MSYREIFTSLYLDRKGEFKKSVRDGIVLLSILVVILLFSIFSPSRVLLIPVIAWSISTIVFIYKTRKAKKDNETWGDDAVKKIDDPHKYT